MALPSKYTPMQASDRPTVDVFPLFSSGPCGDSRWAEFERFPSFFMRHLWGWFAVSIVRTSDLYDLVQMAWPVSCWSTIMLRTKVRNYLARYFRTLVRRINMLRRLTGEAASIYIYIFIYTYIYIYISYIRIQLCEENERKKERKRDASKEVPVGVNVPTKNVPSKDWKRELVRNWEGA